MTHVVDDDGFERNRNESRNILKMRFKEYSIGIVLGNKGEKNKISKSPGSRATW